MRGVAWKAVSAALAGFFLYLLSAAPAAAQSTVRVCWYNSSGQCVNTGTSNALPVQIIGGGGGGLSVQDRAAFTAGTSNFTPTGGEYTSTLTTCTDGTQCTAALSQYRGVITDVIADAAKSAFYAALTSGVGTPGASSPTTDLAIGGEARTSEQTAVTNGQNVKAAFDTIGRQIKLDFAPTALWVTGSASSTDGSAHTVIAAGAGSLKNYITDWECSNTSATSVRVTFTDSASTTVIVPAGGGNNKSLRIPIATAAATAFQFTASTGVSTVYCSAQGFQGI
jgi:hypothetical protein